MFKNENPHNLSDAALGVNANAADELRELRLDVAEERVTRFDIDATATGVRADADDEPNLDGVVKQLRNRMRVRLGMPKLRGRTVDRLRKLMRGADPEALDADKARELIIGIEKDDDDKKHAPTSNFDAPGAFDAAALAFEQRMHNMGRTVPAAPPWMKPMEHVDAVVAAPQGDAFDIDAARAQREQHMRDLGRKR